MVLFHNSLLPSSLPPSPKPHQMKVWFKNRRAKFRKKQRSLQKEQLQKQKDTEANHSEGKADAPVLETQTPTPDAEKPLHLPSEVNAELNLTLSEQSASESAAEDQTDREEEFKLSLEESKAEKSPGAENKPLSSKRASPKAGEEECHHDFSGCGKGSLGSEVMALI